MMVGVRRRRSQKRGTMKITVTSEKHGIRRNFVMHDVFNQEAIEREAKKIIRKQHRDIIDKTSGDYRITHSYDEWRQQR